jgi:hypothetical protein
LAVGVVRWEQDKVETAFLGGQEVVAIEIEHIHLAPGVLAEESFPTGRSYPRSQYGK